MFGDLFNIALSLRFGRSYCQADMDRFCPSLLWETKSVLWLKKKKDYKVFFAFYLFITCVCVCGVHACSNVWALMFLWVHEYLWAGWWLMSSLFPQFPLHLIDWGRVSHLNSEKNDSDSLEIVSMLRGFPISISWALGCDRQAMRLTWVLGIWPLILKPVLICQALSWPLLSTFIVNH